jgi:hypothetical protein
MAGIIKRCDIGPEFNVIKFRTDELKVSFLSYPEFLTEAHPALRRAVTIDLVTGKARHTDYADMPFWRGNFHFSWTKPCGSSKTATARPRRPSVVVTGCLNCDFFGLSFFISQPSFPHRHPTSTWLFRE